MQQLLKNPDSWSDSSSLCSGSEKSKASTRLTYSSGTSYCKNADVKAKKTSGGSKRVSEVGNAHANTLTAYEIQKNQEEWHRDGPPAMVVILHESITKQRENPTSDGIVMKLSRC